MNITILSFTEQGAATAGMIQKALENQKSVEGEPKEYEQQGSVKSGQEPYEPMRVTVYGKRIARQQGQIPLEESLGAWTGRLFSSVDGLVFVGAVGIAVRAVAPYIQSKKTDPAVVVVDERGEFSISLLAGHLGGANSLALQIAGGIGARPVITTATDINGKFAVDQWAKEQKCVICDLTIAKEISAGVLRGEPVVFHSAFPVFGNLPKELTWAEQSACASLGIEVSTARRGMQTEEGRRTLQLIPKIFVMGIGCRKGISFAQLEQFAEDVLERENIRWEGIDRIATIDLKKEEEGLLALARQHRLPLEIYTAEQLNQVEGQFTPSPFVRSVTGVDNVCERAAIRAGGTRIWMKKETRDGMTMALAIQDFSVRFDIERMEEEHE